MVVETKFWRVFAIFTMATVVQSMVMASERLADARAAVSQWVEVEKTISRETLAWEEKKELLENMIDVAKAEISMMKDQLDEARATTDATEARRAELVKERDQNARLAASIKEFLAPFETQLRALVLRLPNPLQDKLNPFLERFPKDPADTKVGIAERMQSVIGVMAEIQRFDKVVTTGEELLTLPGGETREIYTIHFGLGASYYVTSNGTEGGVGVSSGERWEWETVPDLAVSVKRAIALAKGNSMEAGFLSLPVATNQSDR